MEFLILDKQTLQCIMTEAEVADYGMDKNAIYKNDKRAEDFFRKIMKKAELETGFIKKRGDIAVHAVFLSDESLEITFSVGMKSPLLKEDPDGPDAACFSTAVFRSKKLENMLYFCTKAPQELEACLYKYRDDYFLLADIRDYGVYDTAVLVYLADEYIDELCYTQSIAAFLEEHGQCILAEKAVSVLGRL